MKHTRPPLFSPFDPLHPRRLAVSPVSPTALRTLLVSCCLLGGALVPATAGEPSAPAAYATPKVQQFTLANGLTLIVKPDHRAPTAVHMLWVRVGAMDEVDGTSGVAHVLEHMLFKGTPKVKAGEFSRRVAALGGRENAFTARDYTGYYQQIPAQHLSAVMALEADRFANNQWPDDVFAKELEVVKEERRMRTEESPHARLSEAMMAMVYQAHPYRRPIVGWMSDLDAMAPDDARAFFKRWYTPANAAVVVAGDVDVAQVRALTEKTYGRIKARPVPPRKPREEPTQHGVRRMDFKAPAEQAFVNLAFKVPSLDVRTLAQPSLDATGQDALALTVLSAVLDGYDGARLDRALTQPADHVADSAGSFYGLTGRGPQLFMLQGIPASGKTAAQVEQALREQVQRIAKEGVRDAELQRVKTQWVAGEVYRQDSVFNQAQTLGANWVQGAALDADERLIAHLRGVTAAQVQAVAQRYFGDDALTVATLLPQPMDKTPKPRAPKAGARH